MLSLKEKQKTFSN